MIEQAVTITDQEIVILAQFFIHKDYSITNKEVLLDILGQHYQGQHIRVRLLDGENIEFSGFDHYLKQVCDWVGIPRDRVIFETHDPDFAEFDLDLLRLGIFVTVGQLLPKEIDKNLAQAKFIGCLYARYNLTRLRLAYELDQAFPGDTYINFQPRPDFVQQTLRHFGDFYQQELEWLNTKQFDRDLNSPHHMGMIGWKDACANYNHVWNRYLIEAVSETDAIDNFWFTEKTANCLATGKPFVLASGQHSLRRLQDMGFVTFGSVIDESYDLAKTPAERIKRLTNSLRELYTSSSKDQQVSELYRLASQNIELYRQYAD